jgi:hypothetical protein
MTPATKMELTAMREAFRHQADEAFDQMFGMDGQNGLVTFTERETRACEVTDDLARWLMIKHVERDEAGRPLTATCPLCGGPALACDGPLTSDVTGGSQEDETQSREIQTRRGTIDYERAARRCPRCRKIFFPR